MNRETFTSTIATVMLLTSIVFTSCGMSTDNAQPEIDPIDDQTIETNDTRRIPINITDADMDDTHSINASSDNPRVADVSVDADSLIIIANTAGIATITITATDDSGQDNAISIPVTFQVTVNAPLINKGMCVAGMTLQPGESCTYTVDQVPITLPSAASGERAAFVIVRVSCAICDSRDSVHALWNSLLVAPIACIGPNASCTASACASDNRASFGTT